MLINTTLEAIQLCKGDKTFAGAPVKNITTKKEQDPIDEDWVDAFALVRDSAGNEFKVNCGQWLLKHSNGALEVKNSIEEEEEKPKEENYNENDKYSN